MATDWPSVALGTVVVLGSYTAAAVTYLATTLVYLFGLAMWPIAALYRAALIVCAPALYLAQFVLAPFIAVLSLVPRLEVLYIFFGTAALVGIIAGVWLQITSSIFNIVLGIHGGGEAEMRPLKVKDRLEGYAVDPKALQDDDASSQDSDSFWTTQSDRDRVMAPNTSRRRVPGLLLRETIHEEDDSM